MLLPFSFPWLLVQTLDAILVAFLRRFGIAAEMLQIVHFSALAAIMQVGLHQAYSLPAPPPPKSPSNVPSGGYLTVTVPPPKVSGDMTAEPTTALVPSWVLASDNPAKAPEDCTITMEIGYVRKWCVPTIRPAKQAN